MPAKKRIFREDILAASVNVIRKWGPGWAFRPGTSPRP